MAFYPQKIVEHTNASAWSAEAERSSGNTETLKWCAGTAVCPMAKFRILTTSRIPIRRLET